MTMAYGSLASSETDAVRYPRVGAARARLNHRVHQLRAKARIRHPNATPRRGDSDSGRDRAHPDAGGHV